MSPRARRSERASLIAAVGFSLGLMSLLFFGQLRESHSKNQSHPVRDGNLLGGLDQPCGGNGTSLSLATASGTVPYKILVPQDAAASAASMTHLWKCQGTEVEMQFASGINILLDQNTIQDPAKAWSDMAAAQPTDTSVGTVRGQPAALIDPAADPTGGISGSVSVVDGNMWIVVEGNGRIPLATLERVANSLS
jgi:hypothetical protein